MYITQNSGQKLGKNWSPHFAKSHLGRKQEAFTSYLGFKKIQSESELKYKLESMVDKY